MSFPYQEVFSDTPNRLVDVKDSSGQTHKIPSFVNGEQYAENFGSQWTKFRDTQLDSKNGTTISKKFLEEFLDFPVEHLAGKTILEIGSGAGRFTEYFIEFAAMVVSMDLSRSVFSNSCIGAKNLVLAQANFLQQPQLRMKFDLVFCRGVLQHTPNPRAAVAQLLSSAKPGGLVVFDIYPRQWWNAIKPKYLWRPLVRKLFTYKSLDNFLEKYGETILRMRWRIKPYLPGKSKRVLDYFLPVWDYQNILPLTENQLFEWGKLDTLDGMMARYDNPMSHAEVLNLLASVNCKVISSDKKWNFFRVSVPDNLRNS